VPTLKLFRKSDPFRLLESRDLPEGALVIGRSLEADWPLADPERLLSRRHLAIESAEGGTVVRDLSTNGVFLGRERERLRPGEPVTVSGTETLRFGDYLLVVEFADNTPPAIRRVETAILRAFETPSPRESIADAPLLEAFCEGAGLDASAFADEAPEEVMRRAGAVYREMIAGLSRVSGERTALKVEQAVERTAIGPDGNNPFRWAGADRVGRDLLKERGDGFLSGPDAVTASFDDVSKHLTCSTAGMAAAWAAALEALSPAAIEQSAPRGALGRRQTAALWRAYAEAHAELAALPAWAEESPARRAFVEAYQHRLAEFDASVEETRP
jgi:predicted component of type VI protein secretion system